jgi:diguanylate cyclase (GGDEF)-like protein
MARHRLRDSHEAAFLTVARYEGRLKDIEPQLFNDPVTGLRNRIGLEVTLATWFEQKRHHSRQISAALLDIDAFGELNETYGCLIGDRILYQLAQVVDESAGKSDLVGRFAGQQFLRMLVDVGPRAAIKSTEMLRQTIERVTFRSGSAEIRVTAGCAITEVKPEDTEKEVFQRLAAALKAAKKAGPNHCFLSDRRGPEPVESPNFGADYREIVI